MAEITKRDAQSRQVLSQLDGVKEQLRVALSTLQEAIGGLQMQMTQNKEYLLNEVKKYTQMLVSRRQFPQMPVSKVAGLLRESY